MLMQQVMQIILQALTQAESRSPLPSVQPSSVEIPALPVPTETLLAQIQDIIAQSMNPAHPGYMGHMDPIPTTFSLLGDWVAAALNNNMLSVEMSPVLSRLEVKLLRVIAQQFGLGETAGGLLVSGGSLANLQALVVARNAKLGTLKQGVTGIKALPVVFTSEMAHTSVKKAAMLAGLGTEGVIAIPANAQAQMDPQALEERIHQALCEDQRPFMAIATAGTTVTGNIDPLPEIAAIARQYDLWFHVDAAYGGALVFSPTHRPRLQGIELADSVTFNPQKWVYVAKTCAAVLFRDMAILDSQFRVAAPYMNAEADWPNLGELTVQGTRHCDVLKLWLSLQHLGQQGCAALIDASYELTAQFVNEIRQRSWLVMASEPEMNLICFRGQPEAIAPDRWDGWNAQLQRHLLETCQIFLSLPVLREQRWLKAVLLNPHTTPAEIQKLFAAIDAFAANQ